jgi:hypothetical protein
MPKGTRWPNATAKQNCLWQKNAALKSKHAKQLTATVTMA